MSSFHLRTFHNNDDRLHTIETIVLIGLIFTVVTASLRKTVMTGNSVRSDTLRLHIIANSDSDFDQELKLKVRDRILSETGELFADVSGKSEAKALAEYSANDIKKAAEEVISDEGADYPVEVEIVNMWFETRSYDGFTLPAGDYDAVRIIIGEGEGHNWWCVMYPQLCIPGAESRVSEYGENKDFVLGEGFELRFKIIEIFENVKKNINKDNSKTPA